eukprot:7596295-Karenia_brevis.AAC.1
MPAPYLLHALEYRQRACYQSGRFAVKLHTTSILHVTPQCTENGLVPAWMKRFLRWGCGELSTFVCMVHDWLTSLRSCTPLLLLLNVFSVCLGLPFAQTMTQVPERAGGTQARVDLITMDTTSLIKDLHEWQTAIWAVQIG